MLYWPCAPFDPKLFSIKRSRHRQRKNRYVLDLARLQRQNKL